MILMIDMAFVTLNEYINAERSNRQKAARIKKFQTDGVCWIAIQEKFKLNPGKYDVNFIWMKPNNKKDHDNIAFCKKFILDGLVKAKVIQSDGSKFINNFQDRFVLDNTKPYIYCIVEFIKVK